jgi:prepilin-type N-terminal cleavage/methylation domain-containing protein
MNTHGHIKFRGDGFSLIEMLVVVLLIGILTVVAVPRFNLASVYTKRDEAFVRKLLVDLRKTRQMAIANAADNPNGFQLRINVSSPKGYEIRNTQTSQVIETFPVDSRITFSGTTQFSFTPLGALNPSTNVQLTVAGEGKTWVFDVYGYTGSVKCTEQ